mgnify:CR=1 FL=1
MMIDNDNDLRRILKDCRVIAMVGLSSNEARPSNEVARYLMARGYTVIPVNPVEREILGQPCYARLADIPQKVDIVDCFRKSEDIPPIAREAIAIGAKVLWMQLHVINGEAAKLASDAGLEVVMNRCPKIEYGRLMAG